MYSDQLKCIFQPAMFRVKGLFDGFILRIACDFAENQL